MDTEKKLVLAESNVAILAIEDDRPFEDIEVPEWNCIVRIKAMRGRQAVILSQQSDESPEVKREGMARIVALSAVNSKGELLFPDYRVLLDRSTSVLNPLQDAALRVNKFTRKGGDVKKD